MFLLDRRSVPYTQQAIFTIASYPFSMKVDKIMLVCMYHSNLLMSGSLGPDC